MKSNIISLLKNRNLIYQITKEKELLNYSEKNKIIFYCGFDPTYDSLHIGHLIPILCIKKFIDNNHKVIIVIGGSTALIGDPSFRFNKRENNYNIEIINDWSNKISNQISKILNINNNNILILNNYNWLNSINIIDFLQKIGDKININSILNKEFIKHRIKNFNKLSFKEFSYNILQSYDYLYLYNKYNVILQIGGSDQWGNIISGINLIRKINKKSVYGITLPILTTSNGYKLGKSSNNNENIWLDNNKTSPYNFYQFWINIPDNKVCKYLNYFTDISNNDIKNIYYNKYIISKKIIADNLTKLIYGSNGLSEAIRITNNLFSKKIINLNEEDFYKLSKDRINKIELNKEISLQELLLKLNIEKSKSKINNIINEGSIKINGKVQNNIKYNLSNNDILYKKYTLISKGKKKFYLILWK